MRRSLIAALLASSILPGAAQARTLDLAFLPPDIQAEGVCLPRERGQLELEIGPGDDELTDKLRIRYLNRDIRRLQADDPVRWFDFIGELIDRRAAIDPNFEGVPATLAQIALHVDAVQTDRLIERRLIDGLRASEEMLTNGQKLELAQYFLNGIGVARDVDYARALIRDAAFGGHPDALLSLARMELEGNPVPGWDAPLDLTVTMAFSGMLGQLNEGVCRRAERIANAYATGDIVSQNARIAYAWHKFAADMGSGQGAWRVVEWHLGADAAEKDDRELRHYLRLAAERGVALGDAQAAALKASGAVDDDELRRILGYNYSEDDGRNRPSVAPHFVLDVNLDGEEADEESKYMLYLREIAQLPTAPGWVFTSLAKETLVAKGRWRGEPDAMRHLEEAARRGDPEGTQLLGRKLVRWRDDPETLARAIDVLQDTVTRHGMAHSMRWLDGIYRCQAPAAPLMEEALLWERNYDAAQVQEVRISATDLLSLDPHEEPLPIAQIQSQALLTGYFESMAHQLQRVQVDPFASERAHRWWARHIAAKDQSLEAFAQLEFELATNPAERDMAMELFRRVYLHNGVKTARDLALAIIEDEGNDHALADEVIDLLTQAANRGEGSAIRLKARLLAQTGMQAEAETFAEYAQIIEDRGDFLAMMFAIPHVGPAVAEDYFDRAVSLMSCGTKDVAEIADAHAKRGDAEMAWHWIQIGLVIEGGHSLAKLRLSDRQMERFDKGPAPDAQAVRARALADGDATANRGLWRLTADPDLPTFDAAEAADHFVAIVRTADAGDLDWALASYRRADGEVKDAIAAAFDVTDIFRRAAETGNVGARYELALILRDEAKGPTDLISSARWLEEAAEAGHRDAMRELGHVLAYGIGTPADPRRALMWLDRAADDGDAAAAGLARVLRLSSGQ